MKIPLSQLRQIIHEKVQQFHEQDKIEFMKKPTQEEIDKCMDYAVKNGHLYEAYDMSAIAVARNMIDAGVTDDWDYNPRNLVPLIKNWRSRNPKP